MEDGGAGEVEGEHVGREGRRRDKQVGKMLGLRGHHKGDDAGTRWGEEEKKSFRAGQ